MSACPECGRDTVAAGACTDDCGWVEHEAVAILTDLIAELRSMPGFLSTQRSAVERLADRAEVRLQGTTEGTPWTGDRKVTRWTGTHYDTREATSD